MRRATSKIQSIYSRGGVPKPCLILRSEGCNVCARRRQWNNKWRPCQRRQQQWRRCGGPNKLFQHRLEQNMADNCLSHLVQKMADVVLIIALRQFWLRKMFFWQASFTKKQGGICWQPKLAPTSLTGLTERSDRSRHCGLSDRDRPVWPVQVESEYN